MNLQAQSIAKTLLDDKRSIVDEVKRAKKILNYKRLFDETDYFESNRGLYHGAIVLAIICQITTAYSSYNYYAKFETFNVLNEIKPFVISLLLIGIEVIKFMLCKKAIPTIFKNPKPIWLVLAGIIVFITIYTRHFFKKERMFKILLKFISKFSFIGLNKKFNLFIFIVNLLTFFKEFIV